ncbi:MAG: ArsB/NhaD family transporter [Bdellovibrionota bacterium]
MNEVVAYSTLALTVGAAVARPRLGASWRIGPATAAGAGVLALLLFGVVEAPDILASLHLHWRPFITIICTMITAAAAEHLGVLERISERIFSQPDVRPSRLFGQVFFLSAITSSLLNNDAMVILLTPLVLSLVRKRYPGHAKLLAPFAFAVFAAVGVAPFVISNPMNMIVAQYAHLNFNQYASWMVPVTLAGWAVTYPILYLLFSRDLALVGRAPSPPFQSFEPLSGPQRAMVGLLFGTIGAYAAVAFVDGPSIWIVAVAAAAAGVSLVLARQHGGVDFRELFLRTVAWDIFAFLLGIYVIAIGLRNAGLTARLAEIYTGAGIWTVGATAALGSAVLNNHPMSLINLMALEITPGAGRKEILAGLIGGDLGPRLLPVGSLAGLLWIGACRRMGVEISLRRFVAVGLALTIPAMVASLFVLYLRGRLF